MPSYEYRCPDCGIVEKVRPMGAATPAETCPTCGAAAKRVFSAPSLSRTPRPLASVVQQADKSRHEPAVVRREPQPTRRDTPDRVNPALRKLIGTEAARNLRQARHPAQRS